MMSHIIQLRLREPLSDQELSSQLHFTNMFLWHNCNLGPSNKHVCVIPKINNHYFATTTADVNSANHILLNVIAVAND